MKMQRIFAHRIIFEGRTYVNHVIELDDNGRVRLFPFEEEVHSTTFVSGSVVVELRHRPAAELVWRKEV